MTHRVVNSFGFWFSKVKTMKKQHFELSVEDEAYLEALLSRGTMKVRKQNRILGLLGLYRGKTYESVVKLLKVSRPTVKSWADKYKAEA